MTSLMGSSSWICCQLGAREHYVVARALVRRGLLERLVTDAWWPQLPVISPMTPTMLRNRFDRDVPSRMVSASNLPTVVREVCARMNGCSGWNGIIARNEWFQKVALRDLTRLDESRPRTLFAYSYAALHLMRWARSRGWRTVLGQIDPGPAEERIVAELVAGDGGGAEAWKPAPGRYWQDWREECALADRIVVNSKWSQVALEQEGGLGTKIRVVPLAYELPSETTGFSRQYPACFGPDRPMRVLFLGQINIRKGATALLEAIRIVAGEPIEFWFVGEEQITVDPSIRALTNIRWFGHVARSDTHRFYREADVFILPTWSDGFGLTQLEAQAWRLPVIASAFCGDVVRDGHNGLVLAELKPEAIATALRDLLHRPEKLRDLSRNTSVAERFSLARLAENLIGVFD